MRGERSEAAYRLLTVVLLESLAFPALAEITNDKGRNPPTASPMAVMPPQFRPRRRRQSCLFSWHRDGTSSGFTASHGSLACTIQTTVAESIVLTYRPAFRV